MRRAGPIGHLAIPRGWSASRGRGGVHRRVDQTTGNYSTAPLPRRRAGNQPSVRGVCQRRGFQRAALPLWLLAAPR